MKILVATDGSLYSDEAVSVVAERPWPPDAEFRVLNVMEHLPIAVAGDEYTLSLADLLAKIRAESEQIVKSAVESFRGKGYMVSQIIREGPAAEEILNEARDWHADLIIVGTKGRHGISRFLLGSVAQRVAVHALCSVEIVRAPNKL